LQEKYLRFFFDGLRLKGNGTAAEYGLEDKSVIDVMNEAVGGRSESGVEDGPRAETWS
jgi:hypothetical protein